MSKILGMPVVRVISRYNRENRYGWQVWPSQASVGVSPRRMSITPYRIPSRCLHLCLIRLLAFLLLFGDAQRTSLRLSQELVVGLRCGVAACRRLQLEYKVIVREDKLCCAAADAFCIACCSIRK